MLNGKITMMLLTSKLIKNIQLYKMSCSPEPHTHSKNKIEDKLDLYKYVTKSNSKKATYVNKSYFAKKVDLTSLKSDVDKNDTVQLINVPSGLRSSESKVNKLDIAQRKK